MAVAVDAGESAIRFNYRNTGLSLGVTITVTAAVIFIIYILVSALYLKKHPSSTEYPEGDKLLKQWRADDIAEAALKYQNQTTAEIPLKSILDRLEDDPVPTENRELEGGFRISDNAFGDDEI